EKALKEHGDAVAADEKAAAESALEELKTALKSDDVDVEALRASVTRLEQASAKLSEAAVKAEQAKAQGAQGGAEPGGPSTSSGTADGSGNGEGPKAEDADFKVVD